MKRLFIQVMVVITYKVKIGVVYKLLNSEIFNFLTVIHFLRSHISSNIFGPFLKSGFSMFWFKNVMTRKNALKS